MSSYKFLIPHRHFKAGDLVPASYTSGMIQTMLASGHVAAVAEPKPSDPAKSIDAPPADKMVRGSNPKVQRKGVA